MFGKGIKLFSLFGFRVNVDPRWIFTLILIRPAAGPGAGE